MRLIHYTYLLLVIGILLSGCISGRSLITPIATEAQPSSPTSIPPTSRPTDTPRPTQTTTLTPIPALSEQDALETFINLIEKDGDCELPCWLGVTPGQIRFEEVENIFSQFSAIASTTFSSQSAFIRIFFPNFETATHDTAAEVSPAEDGKVSRILVNTSTYQNINGARNYNNPEFQRMWQRYFVSGISTSHGPPEKVFLDTTRIVADTAGPYPFVLWIVYPQQAFLIRYEGVNSKIGDSIRICPMQSRIEIKIWDVEESSYEEFIKDDGALASPFSLGPQPIENVTDFDLQSFYKMFKDGEIDTCFETPSSIWPH